MQDAAREWQANQSYSRARANTKVNNSETENEQQLPEGSPGLATEIEELECDDGATMEFEFYPWRSHHMRA